MSGEHWAAPWDAPGAIDQGTCDGCGVSLGDWTEDGLCGDCQKVTEWPVPGPAPVLGEAQPGGAE